MKTIIKCNLIILTVLIIHSCATINIDLQPPKQEKALVIINGLSNASMQFNMPFDFKLFNVEKKIYIDADGKDQAGNNYFINLPLGTYKIGQIAIKAHVFNIVTYFQNNNKSKLLKTVQFDPTSDFMKQNQQGSASITFSFMIGKTKLEYEDTFFAEFDIKEPGIHFLGEYKIVGKSDFPKDMLNLYFNKIENSTKLLSKIKEYLLKKGKGWELSEIYTDIKIFKSNKFELINY